jgi:hypothetical protein
MSDIVYPNLEEMAARMPDDAARVFTGFQRALFEVMFEQAEGGIVKRTPVREGTLLGSIQEDKQDQRYSVGFTDPKANALDRGRKRSQPFSRRVHPLGASDPRGRRGRLLGAHGTAPYTRMLGSKQPQSRGGMTLRNGFDLRANWPVILGKAADLAGGSEPE